LWDLKLGKLMLPSSRIASLCSPPSTNRHTPTPMADLLTKPQHSPLRSCTGEGELGFWEAHCTTAQVLHHGSSSIQVRRCCLPPSSLPSTPTSLLQRCHQQHYCCDYLCKQTVRATCSCLVIHHVLRVHVLLLLVSVHLSV
jgi:hypothetical protein